MRSKEAKKIERVLKTVDLTYVFGMLLILQFIVSPVMLLADQAMVINPPNSFWVSDESSSLKAFHIPLHGSTRQKEYILATIDKLEHKYNALFIMVNNKVIYDRYPEITSSEAEDMRAVKPGWRPMTKKDLREIVLYAQGKGLEVIPEVKFLTHQEKFLRRSHPELMLNEVTYNPNKPKVYDIVFAVIDELVEIFKPHYFHIGHDEMREVWKKKANNKSKIPTYQDFANDANRIADYLKTKGVRTMMWGDMLLNPDDLSLSNNMRKTFHGGLKDYYKASDLLSKDIIIIDWHYDVNENAFPSVDYFLSKGFSVMGATYKNRVVMEKFVQYVCTNKTSKILGMIATTWHDFNVRDTAIIDQIITDSAKAFSSCDR